MLITYHSRLLLIYYTLSIVTLDSPTKISGIWSGLCLALILLGCFEDCTNGLS